MIKMLRCKVTHVTKSTGGNKLVRVELTQKLIIRTCTIIRYLRVYICRIINILSVIFPVVAFNKQLHFCAQSQTLFLWKVVIFFILHYF